MQNWHLTWTESGMWTVGLCVEDEPLGYKLPEEGHAHSYTGRITFPWNTSNEEIASLLRADARERMIHLPYADSALGF